MYLPPPPKGLVPALVMWKLNPQPPNFVHEARCVTLSLWSLWIRNSGGPVGLLVPGPQLEDSWLDLPKRCVFTCSCNVLNSEFLPFGAITPSRQCNLFATLRSLFRIGFAIRVTARSSPCFQVTSLFSHCVGIPCQR